VITFDPEKESFKIYRHHSKDTNSVSNDIAHAYIESASGIIWIGTNGGGINAFDPAIGKFRSFTTKDGRKLVVVYNVYGSDPRNLVTTVDEIVHSIVIK